MNYIEASDPMHVILIERIAQPPRVKQTQAEQGFYLSMVSGYEAVNGRMKRLVRTNSRMKNLLFTSPHL